MGTVSPFSVDCSGTSTYCGAVSPHNSCHTSVPTTSGSYGEIPTITITTPPANRAFDYSETSTHPLSQFSNNVNYRPPFKLPSLPQSVTSARNLPGVCDSPSFAPHVSDPPVPLRSTVLSDSKTSTDTSNTTSSGSKHGSAKHKYSLGEKSAVKRSLTQPILETEMTNFKPDYTSSSTHVKKVPRLQHDPLKRSRSSGSLKFKKFKQRVQALRRRNSAYQLEACSDCSDSDPNLKSYKKNQDGDGQVKRKKSLRKSVFTRAMSPIQASPLLQGSSDSDSSQLFCNNMAESSVPPAPSSHTMVRPVLSHKELQRVQTLSDSDPCNSSQSSAGAASSKPVARERKYPPYVFKSNSYKGYMKEKKPPSKVTLAWMDLSTDDNSSTSQMGHPGKSAINSVHQTMVPGVASLFATYSVLIAHFTVCPDWFLGGCAEYGCFHFR